MPPVPDFKPARQPLAGVAFAAVAGILLADAARRWLPAADADLPLLPWVADGLFLTLAAAFCARPRPGMFWALAVAGFAALHLFRADPVPAAVLARRLDPRTDGRAHVVRAVGTVETGPHASARHPSPSAPARFTLALENIAVDDQSWPSRAWVSVEWRDAPPALAEGDRLELTGLGDNLAGPRNPGEFDFAAFARRRGIRSEIHVSGLADGRITRPGGGGWLTPFAARVHDAMERTLRADLQDDPSVGAVVSTMLLGLRDDPGLGDLEPVFQRTGTLHYFAIDGLKLGLVAAVLRRALATTGLPRAWAGALVLPLLGGYALATGLGPASLRALLVAGVLLGGRWTHRPVYSINNLGAAALVLLALDTNQLFHVGFQLTFLVVLAILWLAPTFNRWLHRIGAPDPFVPESGLGPVHAARGWLRRRACELAAVALAAWLGSLPVMMLDYGLVSPVSPFANVAAFPLAFAVVALGTLSLAGAWVARFWVLWMNNANWLAARLLLAVARAADAVPGGSLQVGDPALWHWQHPPAAEITVLDLGRARAAHLRAGGADWLIDTGRLYSYSRWVRPALHAAGVERLGGGLILTRADVEHLAAAGAALADYRPVRVVDGALPSRSLPLRDFRRELVDASGRARAEEVRCRRGDVLTLAPGVEARVLYPPDEKTVPATAAARALVLRVEAAGWRVLLLPDGTDGPAARWLLAHETPEELRSAVLIADPSVGDEFVRAVGARLVVVRSGRENEPWSTREPARAAAPLPVLPGVEVMAQEESGAVDIRIDPERIEASGFVDGREVVLKK